MPLQKTAMLLSVFLAACTLLVGCGGSGSDPVATIVVTSAQSSVAVSGIEQFMATAEDSRGNIISGVTFNWSSSDTNVATINSTTGVANGLLPGATQITASGNGITSEPVTLTVTPGFLLKGNMNAARYFATATLLNNGMVLIAGGYGSSGALASAELFNPATGTFAATGSLNTARYYAVATLLNNGTVLIAGGYNSGGFLTSAEIYDPASGAFTPTGDLNTARRFFTSTLLNNGKVLIAGGYGAIPNQLANALSSAELYDPVTGTFMPTGSMNDAHRLATATLLNDGKVLIAGGLDTNGNAITTAELYDPNTGTFTLTGSLNAARYYHTATLLNDGTVLIAGGALPGPPVALLASAEIYNPATGTFAATGNLTTARYAAKASLLNNGTVLLVGGDGNGASGITPTASADLYDPTTGAFAATGSMNAARFQLIATLLQNGDVLVAGGDDTNNNAESSAELYEPGTFTPPGLQSISVAPAGPTISPGTYQRYIATGTFAGGPQQLASVTWSSSDTTTAQISNDVTNPGASVAVGSPTSTKSVTIAATAGTISGTAALNVRPTGFVSTGDMGHPREFFTATALNDGTVLATGGDTSQPPNSSLYETSEGVFIDTGIPAIGNRTFFTATLLMNGMVLIVGGNNGSTLALNGAELYDPATETFSATGNLNVGRYLHTATRLANGEVLIAGGQTSDSNWLNSAELYDPASGTFALTGNLNIPRGGHTATPLSDGTVLIAGGQTTAGGFVGTGEIYNSSTGTFSTTGSLATPREFHTATLLPGGTVFIAGGLNGSASLARAELYNVATESFTSAGNLATSRYFHTATLLATGNVLIAGGINTASGVLSSTEIYNPASGTITSGGNMTTARASHAATLLDNGQLLIVGGAGASVLSSAELY